VELGYLPAWIVAANVTREPRYLPCGTARLLVIRAFLVLVNPLYFLGLWLGLKVFSLFTNFLSTMGIRCLRFFSVGRRAALSSYLTSYYAPLQIDLVHPSLHALRKLASSHV